MKHVTMETLVMRPIEGKSCWVFSKIKLEKPKRSEDILVNYRQGL